MEPGVQTSRYRRATALFPLVLGAAAVAAYANSLSGPFVYDDRPAIVFNEHIRNLVPLSRSLSAPPASPVSGRPVISFTLAVNYALDKLDVRSYHLFNIAVHACCALVLFGVIRRTLRSDSLRVRFGSSAGRLALASALLWTVHPIQTECVDYTIQRTASVMALFYLLTLYCAIRANVSKRRYWWYGGAVLCCALGMASKESMVTAPVAVLLYDLVFRTGSYRHLLRQRWMLYAGLAATWAVLAVLNATGPRSDAVGFSLGVSALDYAKNQCLMIIRYLRLAVWPHPLSFDYGYPAPRTWAEVLPHAVAVVGLLVVTMLGLKYRPKLAFPAAWVFLILGPTSSFVPIATEVGAERRMYLPLAGIVVLLVLGGWTLLRIIAGRLRIDATDRGNPGVARFVPWVGSLAVAVVSTGLLAVTVQRNKDYRSEASLWQGAIQAVADNPRAHVNLAYLLAAENEHGQAVDHYRRALDLQPKEDYSTYVWETAKVHYNLAVSLVALGRSDEAADHYRHALRIEPKFADAHHNLGIVLAAQGKYDEAIAEYRQAIASMPSGYDRHTAGTRGSIHFNLGVSLMLQERWSEAIQQYRKAIDIAPDLVNARYNLGIALVAQGMLDEAIREYRKVLQAWPGFAGAHVNLADALMKAGRTEDAIPHYSRALAASPSAPTVHHSLGLALARLGRTQEALQHLRTAVHQDPSSPVAVNDLAWMLATNGEFGADEAQEALQLAEHAAALTGRRDIHVLDTLAAAYAATGDFGRAVSTAQTAISLASQAGATNLADGIRDRLDLYNRQEPYRQLSSSVNTTEP